MSFNPPRARRPIGARGFAAAVVLAAFGAAGPALAAWEPTKPVEFVVPAGTGGGADQMARLIQGIVVKHKLMKESLIVVNKSGGAGAEGFLDVKGAKGDPHKIIITLSNLFTTPMATGVPFNWKDMTPVSMMALDQFVLWVNAEKPYKTANEYIAAVKAGGPEQDEDGRHRLEAGRPDPHRRPREGDRHQVHLHPVQGRRRGRRAAGRQPRRLDGQQPDRGGRPVARRRSCGRSASSTTSACRTRPRSPTRMSWGDIPTCKESGVATDYVMLRGIFMAPGVTPDQVAFYVDLLKKVRDTPDWKEFMEKGAFNTTVDDRRRVPRLARRRRRRCTSS